MIYSQLKNLTFLFISISLCISAGGFAEDIKFEEARPDIFTITQTDPRTLLELRKAVDQISKSKTAPVAEIINSKSETIRLNLNQSEEMPVVYGLKFNPTSVEFLDVTGEPWPIRKFKGYNGAFLDIEDGKDDGGHILFMSPKKNYGEAVVAVLLDGLPTAINFIVKSDNTTYHRVKKIQIMRLGTKTPVTNVNLQIADQAGQEIDDNLLSASYGVRPSGFKSMKTEHEQIVAWTDDKRIYAYSSLNPILPEPLAVGSGQNPGWRAYSFPITSRLTMSNDIGSIVEIQLESAVSQFESSGKKYKKLIDIDGSESQTEDTNALYPDQIETLENKSK